MPQKVIRFTGINRKVNEFAGSGACEELINLRPQTGGGHHVIKPKRVVIPNVDYVKFYVHTYGDVYNQIAVTSSGDVVWVNTESENPHIITSQLAGKDIELSSAGNVLAVYSVEDKQQYMFKFEDGAYSLFGTSMKRITGAEISYRIGDGKSFYNTVTADDDSANAMNAALLSAASGFNAIYPNGLCGAAVVGCSYELEDGSELWSTAFTVANVTRHPYYTKPVIDGKDVTVYGASKVYLVLNFDDTTPDYVKKINIYASRPVFPYEIEYTDGTSHKINELTLEDANLDGQIMFYQGSVSPDQTEVNFALDFGSEQAGEAIMNVTSGCIERTGEIASYNNRFHYYRSEVQHVIQVPTASFIDYRENTPCWVAYVNINDEWKLVDGQYTFGDTSVQDFIYPMAGIKKLAFVKANKQSDGSISVPYSEMFYVDLKDSSAYNYSYAFGVKPSIESAGSFYNTVRDAGQLWGSGFDTKVFYKKESNAINVSAPYNPFVFPVEYSYSFGGEIIDMATSYMPISSTQVGQYPLIVFTSNGIFSMEQGDGKVLYSNIVPLQPLVLEGKSASTPYGTFFVSSKSLYLLSGREVANLSYILNGERELNIRELESYKILCCGKKGAFHDFSQLLSSTDFEEFVSGAILTYDQLHNELFISSSNPEIHYSYVFGLDTKSYHKTAKRYLESKSGSRYVIEVSGEAKNVVDLHVEDKADQPILLQSRPMPFEAAFTHIQRMILYADAALKGENNLCLSVFASDNLYDWKCIISSQKQDTVLRQIRTNKSGKSYRDYIILISGEVDTDTDLSELIADYTVVSRRLG